MEQLFFVKKGKLEWREVNSPKIVEESDALVRPFAVAKCDLDDAFLFHNIHHKIKIGERLGIVDPHYLKEFGSLLKGPFPFGHECVAQITELGSAVTKYKIGDVVTVPFQLSCGKCSNCNNGFTGVCESHKPVSTYGFGIHPKNGGAMSDFLRVPNAEHMLLKIPNHIDPVSLASLSDNIPDAYRHVKHLKNSAPCKILVISGKAKSVGLYTVLLANQLGNHEVDYLDPNISRLELAKQLGANQVFENFSHIQQKYDLLIDTSSTRKGLELAIKSVRNFGTISSSGLYIKKTPISLIQLYKKGVQFKIGMANARADAAEILNLMDSLKIDFGLVTTLKASWDKAIDAFLTDSTKVVVYRDQLTFN